VINEKLASKLRGEGELVGLDAIKRGGVERMRENTE